MSDPVSGRPKLCPSCGKLMGVGNVCPYCGADVRKVTTKLAGVARGMRNAGQSGHPVTLALIAVNVFLFALTIAVGGVTPSHGGFELLSPSTETVFRLGLQYNPAIVAGDWWRIIMPIFLHLGVLHILFNCMVLWTAGRVVEQEIGSRLMFMVYMLAGIIGFVASYFADIGGAGASGAVSGLIGFLLVRRWLVDGNLRHPVARWALQLTAYTAIFGLVVSRVNNVAHLAGYLVGVGLAVLLTKVKLSRSGAVGLMLLTTGLGVLTVAAFVAMGLSLGRASGEEVIAIDHCVSLAQSAVTDGERSIDADRASRALECFQGTGEVGTGGDEALDRVRASLAAGRDASERGELSNEQRAASELTLASREFKLWLRQNAGRYGLSVGLR